MSSEVVVEMSPGVVVEMSSEVVVEIGVVISHKLLPEGVLMTSPIKFKIKLYFLWTREFFGSF